MSDFNLIGQVKIDTGNSNDVIKNLNGNIQVLATKLNDVEVKSGGANNSLKNFFKEQRLQDRTMREGIQSITSLALVFNTLGGNSSEASKKLGESLSMAAGVMNSMEFAGFGLSQMGKGLGGTLGMLVGRIGGMLGPIGMVVGVGAGLLEFFDDSKEKAEKARIEQEKLNKSLEDYKNKLEGFTSGEQARAMATVLERQIASERETVFALRRMGKEDGTSVLSDKDFEYYEQKFTQVGLNIRNFTSAQLNEEISKLDKTIEQNEIKLKQAKELVNLYTITPKKVGGGKTETDTETAEETAQKKIDAENKYRNFQIEFAKDEKTRIQLEKEDKLKELDEIAIASGKSADEIKNMKIAIEEDFQKKIDAIDEQVTEKKIEKEKQFADFKKDLITGEIEKINEAEKDKLDIIEQAIKDKVLLEEDKEKLITAIKKDAEEKRSAVTKTEADKQAQIEKTVTDTKIQIANNFLSAAIGFAKEGSDLQRGLAVAQIATNLAIGFVQGLDIAQKGAAGTGPLAPYSFPLFYSQQVLAVMTAVGSAKKALESYATGGFTGDGGRYEEAGMVHRGEVVFEKPLVDKYKNPLLQLRTMMQNGGSYVPYNTNGYDMGTQRELKALRSDMNVFMKQDRNVNVSLKGTLKGQKFLKDEMPKHNKFTKNKYV